MSNRLVQTGEAEVEGLSNRPRKTVIKNLNIEVTVEAEVVITESKTPMAKIARLSTIATKLTLQSQETTTIATKARQLTVVVVAIEALEAEVTEEDAVVLETGKRLGQLSLNIKIRTSPVMRKKLF